MTLTYNAVGPLHNVTVTAFPIMPDILTGLTAAPAGWPATLSAGLTTTQSTWGGRQWQLSPGQSVSVICAPLDNRSFDFEQSSTERGKYDAFGQIAWAGWLVWVWGMTTGDTLTRRATVGEECAYLNNTTTAYAFPTSRNPPKPLVSAEAKDTFSNYMEKGLGAFSYATNTVFPILSKTWNSLSPYLKNNKDNNNNDNSFSVSNLGLTADTNPMGFVVADLLCRSLRRIPRALCADTKKGCAEEKVPDIEDCVMPADEMVTPRNARRPSLSLSLTSRKK
jgi:hypothetical protein